MKLALLAAGFATRMYPLTRDRPKPLLELQGQVLLTRLLFQALETGVIEEAAVVVNARFQEEFKEWAFTQEFPVEVIANEAKEATEAPGALADLRLLLDQGFRSSTQGPWMVLAGDNLMDFSLSEVVRKQAENLEQPLFLVRKIEGSIPPNRYSEVSLDSSDYIKQIREKPDNPSSPYSAIGAYLLPPDLPELLSQYLDQGGSADAPGHLMVWLAGVRNCRAWHIPADLWWDIGNLESYQQARQVRLKNSSFKMSVNLI